MAGVYPTKRKNGETSYRSSFTFRGRHISLGSFPSEKAAHACYRDALRVSLSAVSIADYSEKDYVLPFEKYVSIVNFRDNDVYFSKPIYLRKRFFEYYLTRQECYKFDIDDLFYYAGRKILKRGSHLFVADYGMQVNILNRYGIKSHAVAGRDYRFRNGDDTDFRYENIEVINPYYGVCRIEKNKKICYKASILMRSTCVIGYYDSAEEAAIAYNKAADLLGTRKGARTYRQNYIETYTAREYADCYARLAIPEKLKTLPLR